MTVTIKKKKKTSQDKDGRVYLPTTTVSLMLNHVSVTNMISTPSSMI